MEGIGGVLSEFSNYPPTTLYNEGWLLRLVMDWFSQSWITDHQLSFTHAPAPMLPCAAQNRRSGSRVSKAHVPDRLQRR